MYSLPYSRREGAEDFGHDYEQRMTALFSLRFALSHNCEEFWIASNVNNVGDFDDIVMSVKSNNGKKIAFLIQLKHAESKKTNITEANLTYCKTNPGDQRKKQIFSIEKYWEGFEKFQTEYLKSKKKKVDPIIKELRKADKIILVLYTNKGVDTGNYLKKLEANDNFFDLLRTNDMKHCHGFNHKHEKLQTYNADFLSKLRLFANQLHADQVLNSIENEISGLLNLECSEMVNFQEVTKQYVEYVKSWIKGYKIGDQKTYFTLTKSEVLKILVAIVLDTYKYNFSTKAFTSYSYGPRTIWNQIIYDKTITLLNKNDRRIEFIESYYGSEVRKFIQQPPAVWTHQLFESDEMKFCSKFGPVKVAKVCQNAKLSMALIYKTLWMYGTVPLLLRLKESKLFNESKQFHDILKILEVCQHSIKVIVLVEDVSKVEFTHNSLYFVTFDDLPLEQQEIVLGVEVNFQGRLKLPMMNFVDESMYSIIQCHDVIDILCSEFIIGAEVGEIYEYFIGRCLFRVLLSYDVLEIAGEKFQIEGQLCEPIQHMVELKSTKGTQHRLTCKCTEGYFEWVESIGNISNLRNYQIESEQHEYELIQPETLGEYLTSKRTNRTRVISGSPGMGKSTLMDFVAYAAPSDLWVLKIKLTNMVASIATIEKTDSLSKAEPQPGCSHSYDYSCSDYDSSPDDDYFESRFFDINKYFESIATEDETIPTSGISLAVFKQKYKENKILVLLDGFDEIPNDYKEKVTEIIVRLKTEQYQVWVTTRDHMKTHLENKLSVLALSLKPFTHDEQRSYLINFFTVNIYFSNENIVQEFAKILLEEAKKNLSDREDQFMGIPLQTQLLAECFLKQCRTSCQERKIKLIKRFDLLRLYEMFVKMKKKILIEEKFGSNELVVLEASNAEEAHQCFALYNVLGEHMVRTFNLKKKLMRYNAEIKNGILQRGGILVVRKNNNGIHVDFVHRTFAEYFVAKFLSKNFWRKIVRKNVLSLIEKRFLNSKEHEFIFRIFDSLRARERCLDLHKLIINMKTDIIEHEMEKNRKAFLTLDEFNRSGLHMLAMYNIDTLEKGIIEIPDMDFCRFDRYLESMEVRDLKLTDCFGYNVLDYCFYFCNWTFAAALCRKAFYLPLVGKKTLYRQSAMHDSDFPWSNPDIYKTMFYNFVVRDLLLGRIYETTSISDYCLRQICLSSKSKNNFKLITESGAVIVSDYLTKIGIKDSETSKYLDKRFVVALESKTNVKELLASSDIDVNERDTNIGDTLLHYASYNKRAEIIDLLIEHGADINRTGRKSRTVLHTLARIGQVHLLQKYWDRITNFEVEDVKGLTPLDYALQYNQTDAAVFLIAKGAKLKGVVIDALPYVYQESLLSAIIKCRNLKIAKVLFNKNLGDKTGKTSLHYVAKFGHVGLIINEKNKKESIPYLRLDHRQYLTEDSYEDSYDLGTSPWITRMFEQKLYLNKNYRAGNTPDLLFELTADLVEESDCTNKVLHPEANMKNRSKHDTNYWSGNNSFRYSYSIDNNNLTKEIGDGNTALHVASGTDNIEIVKKCLELKMDVNKTNNDGLTPLYYAVHNEQFETAQLLIQNKANVLLTDWYQNTILHIAAEKGNDDFVLQMLDQNLDLNALNNGNETPLYAAIYWKNLSTAELLLSKGARIDNITTNGNSVLHVAAWRGYYKLAKKFLKEGTSFDINMKDYVFHLSPLGYAVYGNSYDLRFYEVLDLLKLFLKAGASVEVDDLCRLFYIGTLKINTQNRLTEVLNISKEFASKCSNINDRNILHDIILNARKNSCDMNDYSWKFLEEYLKLLVNSGADVRIRNKQGKSVCDLISEDGLDHLLYIF